MPPLLPTHALLRPFSLQVSISTCTPFHFLIPSIASSTTTRPLSSTASMKADQRIREDKRITLIRYHLTHPLTPRPLRLSRLRTLRHWTIHRAYMIYQRRLRTTTERELERQYNSMVRACEELRLLDESGISHEGGTRELAAKKTPTIDPTGANGRIGNDTTRQGGRLYRIAMDKKGIYGSNGWPIEASRALTDWPGEEIWTKNWTR